MPRKMSNGDCAKNSLEATGESGRFDLNLPVVEPGEEPLPHREPHPAALAHHIDLLLRSRRRRSPEERAKEKNPEPFQM